MANFQQLGANSVIEIVVVVGDLIRKIGDLCLETRLASLDEAFPKLTELPRVSQGAVLENALAAFECQVESRELGIAFFELIDHTQRLQVVLETSVRAHALVQ